MPAKLKNLQITGTDLVDAGANPDAKICLIKRKEFHKEDAMLFNKNKSADEQGCEKKVYDPALHPEVIKALSDNAALSAEVEKLRKNLEIKDLTELSKKYQIIGKNPEELALKLYELKNAGGSAYADYVALLDEQLILVERSGLFLELGRNAGEGIGVGDELGIIAADIKKSNKSLSMASAVARAFEENPGLADEYEKIYRGRL